MILFPLMSAFCEKLYNHIYTKKAICVSIYILRMYTHIYPHTHKVYFLLFMEITMWPN